MKGVADLTAFILASLRDENAGRVALYHFLRNFVPQEAPLTPATLNSFYSEALQLNHWQQNRKALQNDIQELLQRFFAASNEPFRLDQIWDLSKLQIVTLENADSLGQTVHEWEQSSGSDRDQVRILMESESRAISLRRLGDGSMIVRSYSNLAKICGSRLVPVGPDQEIHYDASLELAHGHVQKLKISPNSQARFVAGENGIQAQFIGGFAFRQTQEVKIPSVAHEPRLFYPLKRLERFFVHRPSDPYYTEIITSIDRALSLLQSRSEGAQTFALQAFDSGQIAFDQIFPDDKVLYTRLRELAKLINVSRIPDSRPKEVSL